MFKIQPAAELSERPVRVAALRELNLMPESYGQTVSRERMYDHIALILSHPEYRRVPACKMNPAWKAEPDGGGMRIVIFSQQTDDALWSAVAAAAVDTDKITLCEVIYRADGTQIVEVRCEGPGLCARRINLALAELFRSSAIIYDQSC